MVPNAWIFSLGLSSKQIGYFGLHFHPEESAGDGPHFAGIQRPADHLDPVLANGREDRGKVLLRMDQ